MIYPTKINLIDYALMEMNVHTFADLGCVAWVEAAYTFHALDYGARSGIFVDTHFTDTVLKKARTYPNLRGIQGNFGDKEVASMIGTVDCVILFDTLLHQVSPDWDQVLEMYAEQTRCFLIYNPQLVDGTTFRLLELGEEAWLKHVPHDADHSDVFSKLDTPHPDYGGRLWRDVHNIWQWGITDASLTNKMNALGYRCRLATNDGPFGQWRKFENHGFIFEKKV